MSETLTVDSPAADDPKALALVRQGVEQIKNGKITLSDLFGSVMGIEDPQAPSKKPPVPKTLTEAQQDAIRRLPEVYGKVIVTADRKLSPAELRALVEERQVIDTILAVIEKRKSESIREVLSNHLDHLLTDEEANLARKDSKGHFAVKQDAPVDGTGMKVQRSVSGGKPKLTIAHIEDLYAESKIDRPTYLALTKKPDLPRVLDESGLHKAIQKDPKLFFLLGSVAEPTSPTTTIKVVKDS